MKQSVLPSQFDLNAMVIFVKVVQAGSFIGAARALDVPKTTVSRKVAQLEEMLGTRLLQRTTRQSNLTEVGRVYFDRCVRILGDLEEANLAVNALQATPHGTLRISASAVFATSILNHWLAEFLNQYERVSAELILTNQYVDLVAEGIDLAFRATPWGDAYLVGHNLGMMPYWVCASPEYLAEKGEPSTPQDLLNYHCISLSAETIPGGTKWVFHQGNTEEAVCISSRIRANDFLFVKQLVLQHAGIACLPSVLVMNDIQSGRLVQLLHSWSLTNREIYLVYPSDRHLSPKVKAFLDFVLAKVTPQPPWAISSSSKPPSSAFTMGSRKLIKAH